LTGLSPEEGAQLEARLAQLSPGERAQLEALLHRLAALSPAEQARELAEMAAAEQEGRIQALASQARDGAIAVLRGQAERAPLLAWLEEVARQAAEGEAPGSPWDELAGYLRAVAALLRGAPLPPVPAAYAAHLAAIQPVLARASPGPASVPARPGSRQRAGGRGGPGDAGQET